MSVQKQARLLLAFWHRSAITGSLAVSLVTILTTTALPQVLTAGPKTDGTTVNTHGWRLTPAGKQIELGDRPYGMTISPDGQTLLVSNNGQSTQSLMVIDRPSNTVHQTITYESPEALFLGVVYSPDGKRVFASAGGNNKIRVYEVNNQQLTEGESIPLPTSGDGGRFFNRYPAGLTISADGKTLYVANELDDSMAIIDVTSHQVILTPVGHNPYTVVLSKDGKLAYVSNWGEQSVSVVDTSTRTTRQTIKVGTHPSAMTLNPQRNELYVANSDSDTVSIIDTTTNAVTRTINLAPYPGAKEGGSPNALTVAPDGNTLYVANAENNDIAVVRLASTQGEDKVAGMIPTAWYPAAIAIAPDSQELYVANAKGLGAGPNPKGPNPLTQDQQPTPPDQYVGSMIKGTLSIIGVPDQGQLAQYTQQVVENNGFDERDQVRVQGQPTTQVIPRRAGEPSPIKHVIYVIKENRTYDQVFGDLPGGNGDPSLVLFGDESAPNQRELARRFVLLDNFYADAEVSADGWNWSTAALANTYVQKNWPANYSGRNHPYDFEGGNLATAPDTDPTKAYLWDSLEQAGIPYHNYGFWVFNGKVADTEPELANNTNLAYPGYDLSIKDQVRADVFLKDFQEYEAKDKLPTAMLVRLPNDHTAGTRPEFPTPRAMVADNDLALGRIVEAVSKSKFWQNTAIFVVEDDAQNGPDHVDAHRTIALVISPYTQTGKVDSTFYSTSSMLRTMELIVGIPPLTQFDAAATPMLNSFTDQPNPATYTAITPKQPLDQLNTASAPMAAESQAMDLSHEDRAPEQKLNQAIWKSVKGADSQMPMPKTSFRELEKGEEEAVQ